MRRGKNLKFFSNKSEQLAMKEKAKQEVAVRCALVRWQTRSFRKYKLFNKLSRPAKQAVSY